VRDPRFIHVGISYSASVDISLVDQVIESEAWDWIRYSWFCYVLWTTSDTETICRKILRIPGLENSSVFAIALDMNDGFGNLPPAMWDWLRKDRGFGIPRFWTPSERSWPGLPPRKPSH
jgi:hypothetical protein